MSYPATLLGWAFDSVPPGARLVHVEARVAVPAAGANVNVNGPTGTTGYGGTGYLFSRQRYSVGQTNRRCRLLAAGFGLADGWRTIPVTASIAAGASTPLTTLFGLSDPFVARELLLSGSGAGLALRRATGPANLFTIGTAEPSVRLNGVHVSSDLEVFNGTGGALTVRGLVTIRPEADRFGIRCIVTKRALDSASPPAVVRSTMLPVLEAGSELPAWLDASSPVPLVPVSCAEPALLGVDEAFGANVSQAGGGLVPASAVVVVRLLVAAWDDSETRA